MTAYEYYKKHFAQRAIPEEAFDGAVERARVVLNKIKSTYKTDKCNLFEELALYHMAEEIYRDDRSRDVVQRKLGNVSVRYADPRPLEERLFKIAALYLNIYRGVGQ